MCEPKMEHSARHEAGEFESRDYYTFIRKNHRDGIWWAMTVPKARLSTEQFDRWQRRRRGEIDTPTVVCMPDLSPAEIRFVTMGTVSNG